jgi:transposase
MDLDEVVYRVACGLDVHFTFLTACLLTTGPMGKPKVEEHRFPTNQKGLNSLREWLTENGCEAVGMEATGVYWMPVYAALEGACTLVVGNPQHMKNARGQKTDRNDARWIAGQVRHGRIKPSFVPPPEFRGARKAARARRQLIHARTSIRNEIQRGLAESGITLAAFVSDVFGVSGMAILEALSKGRTIQEEITEPNRPTGAMLGPEWDTWTGS